MAYNNVYTITATQGQNLTQGSTITLGGVLGGAGLGSSLNLREESIYYKKIELLEITEDPLVVACTAYRVWTKNNTYYRLLDNTLFSMITNEDRELASDISDYYSKKIMWNNLKGGEQSNYRKDLSTFLHGDRKKIEEKMIPLIYMLPSFYNFDTKFDELKKLCSQDFEIVTGKVKNVSHKVKPIGKLQRKTKNSDSKQYWMIDDNGIPYLFSVAPKNTLLPLFESFFEEESFTISGLAHTRQIDDSKYYSITNLLSIRI